MSNWNVTEPPPKDRPIVLKGAVFEQDELGCSKFPILCVAHFDPETGHWLDEGNLSVRHFACGELQCYAWSDLPEYGDSKPIVLEPPLFPKAADEVKVGAK